MKKNFYTLLFMAVALFSATALCSCSKDDKDDKIEEQEPQAEKYVAIQYWLSDDILEIADIEATGISDIAFTQSMQVEANKTNSEEILNGKACRIIELTGDQIDNTEYSISLKIKENWKEILGTRTQVKAYRTSGRSSKKGETIKLLPAAGITLDLNALGEEKFKEGVMKLAIHYPVQ